MTHFFRLLSLALALLLLSASLMSCQDLLPPTDNSEEEDNTTSPPADGWTRVKTQEKVTDFLTLHGRTYMSGKDLSLFWTYSGFSLRFEGTGVTARLTTSTYNASFPGYLCVYVDGALAPANVVKVKTGKNVLIEGLAPGVHTIEVRKRNEAVYGESATIGVHALSVTNGSFIKESPEEPKLRMEFIGDSITSGFGNMVTDGSGASFTTLTQDGTMTYATLAGRAMGADVHVLSRSGMCYVTGTDRSSIVPYYGQVAALPDHENCTDAWDFEAEPNDVVVINLGTNDSGAKIDGRQITAAQMQEQAVEFLRMVRENNPDAIIVWAYGMIDQGRAEAISAAVTTLQQEGDEDIHFVLLPRQDTAANGVGVHEHPSIQSHILAAQVLCDALEEILDRAADARPLLEAQIRCIRDDRLGDADQYAPADYQAYLALLAEADALVADKTIRADTLNAMAKKLLAELETLLRSEKGES